MSHDLPAPSIRNPQSEISNSSPPEVFDPAKPLPPYTGPALSPFQYEALCRHALAREYSIPLSEIQTGHLTSTRSRHTIRHQIDLYWTSNDGICDFLCFANAKFLKNNVSLHDLMTLIGVQQDINAQKAMMITNTGYSASVLALARERGIALLIVRPAPDFNPAPFPKTPTPALAHDLEKLAIQRINPLYRLNIIHRAFDPSPEPSRRARLPQSAFRDRPSAIPLPQSALSNPQSAIPSPVLSNVEGPPEVEFPCIIQSTPHEEPDTRPIPESRIVNRMVEGAHDVPHPPPRFRIHTK